MGYKDLGNNWNRKWLDDIKAMLKEIYDGKFLPSNSIGEGLLKTDSVETKNIKNKSITNEKIADKSIKEINIEDNAITNSKIADKSIKGNNVDDKTITQVNLADKSVGSNNLIEDSVTFASMKEKSVDVPLLSFVKESTNLFNKSAIQKGGFHNYTTGIWNVNAGYDTSEKIPVRPSQKITAKYVRWACYFDENKQFVKGGFATGSSDILKTIDVPKGVYYIEITCQNVNTAKQQIERGTTLSDFEDYSLEIPSLKVNIEPEFDIKRDSISMDKTTFIEKGKNLLDVDSSVKGYYVNPTTGLLNDGSAYISSLPIQTYGDNVTLTGIRFYALYDKNSTFLRGETLSEGTIKTIPKSNEHQFIRVSPYPSKEASAQVEYGDKVTSVEPYYAILKGVKTEDSIQNAPEINLPKTIYATVNEEIRIYKQNILLDNNLEIRWGRGFQGETYYAETFDSIGDRTLNIEVFENGKLLNSKSVTIKVSNKRSSKISVMMIGDSTVDSLTTEPPSQARLGYHMLQKMGDKLELIGTRGLGTSKHEGRGGWTAKDYRSNKTDVTGTNPFYNPVTKDFDFSYYLKNSSQKQPEIVIVQLGINDLFNYPNDETVESKITEFIQDLTFMKNSIKSVSSTIKVVYNLAIPPTEKIDVFAQTYTAYNLPQWRYKRNNFLGVQTAIKTFENDSMIYLNAINKSINVYDNIRDGVHPTDAGYSEVASQNVNMLNGI